MGDSPRWLHAWISPGWLTIVLTIFVFVMAVFVLLGRKRGPRVPEPWPLYGWAAVFSVLSGIMTVYFGHWANEWFASYPGRVLPEQAWLWPFFTMVLVVALSVGMIFARGTYRLTAPFLAAILLNLACIMYQFLYHGWYNFFSVLIIGLELAAFICAIVVFALLVRAAWTQSA
jgi:hypothetical protein